MTSVEVLAGLGRVALTGLGVMATAYVALYHLTQIAMLAVAWREIRGQKRRRPAWDPRQVAESCDLPGITVIIPAYNEQHSIVRTVASVLDCTYPEPEILVVNDGSTDDTLDVLIRGFDLHPLPDVAPSDLPSGPVKTIFESRRHPNLRVVDKLNGGKADALNAGIGRATRQLVCAIDADVVLESSALFHLARSFLEDPRTVASSGMIRLRNGCRVEAGRIVERALPGSWLERMQVLEYLRAFSIGRMFFNRWGGHLIISGAFGLFRRSTLLSVGGYQPFAIGEDVELVIRLHRHLRSRREPYRIDFVADAVCYTEAPDKVAVLGLQRTRWHQGLLTALRLHRAMLLRRAFGPIGLFVIPYFVAFELLSPLVELAGWLIVLPAWLAGGVDPAVAAHFLAASIGLGSAVSLVAIAIDGLELRFFPRARDQLSLCFHAFLEHLGYHQLNLCFRLWAFPRFYRSVHLRPVWDSPRQAELASDEPRA